MYLYLSTVSTHLIVLVLEVCSDLDSFLGIHISAISYAQIIDLLLIHLSAVQGYVLPLKNQVLAMCSNYRSIAIVI